MHWWVLQVVKKKSCIFIDLPGWGRGVACKMCFSLTFRGLAKWFIIDLVDILIFN